MQRFTFQGLIVAIFFTGAAPLAAQIPANSGSGASPHLQLAQAGRVKPKGTPRPADPNVEKKKAPGTIITVELLTVGDGTALKARQWLETLSKLDVTPTIRPGRPSDKVEVTEKKMGETMRTVTVRGLLDNRGVLTFPDRTFSENDAGKLAGWLNELRTYGAQGDPGGRPAWGLTKEQFVAIHTALKKPLTFEPKEVELTKVLDQFELPAESPLKFSTAALKVLRQRSEPAQVGQSLKGVSQGTALAVLLNEQGLGFRPQRLPNGSVELTISTLGEGGNSWPVGWPRVQSPPETAPALFEIKTIDLEDVPLDSILEAAAGVIKIPILVDTVGIKAKGIDLAEVMISHPRKRSTWITALKSFTFKAKADCEILIDEAGKPFVWVKPVGTPARPQKD